MDLGLIIAMAILATLLGGYIATSIILLRFPHLLHKKKKLKFRPVHISHRGGAGENCENTMTAFRHALKQGTQMLEIDCHLTKDGEVVVAHDSHLLKKCDKDVEIAEVDLKDLPEYRTALTVDFQPSFTLSVGCDRKIPTLREVFAAFPTTPINIDVKVYNTELFQKVNALIKEFCREDFTVWGGRLNTTTKKLHELNSDVPVFFSMRRVLTLLFLFYSGLLPFVPLYESTLEIIMPSIILNRKNATEEMSLKYRILFKFADILLMRPALFKHLDRRGIQTYLWVLNNDVDYEKAFKLGATGVMTDFPSRLTGFLKDNPELVDNWKNLNESEEGCLIYSEQAEG